MKTAMDRVWSRSRDLVKIEHRCKCGRCWFVEGPKYWRDADADDAAGMYCPHCGYHLAPDGFAHEMVRADVTAERIANLKEELVLHDRAEQILEEPIGPVCWRNAIAQARDEAAPVAEGGR